VSGFRIEVDAGALARENWKNLPWRYRIVARLWPGMKRRIIGQAAASLAGKS
jgi:hypothetical protein